MFVLRISCIAGEVKCPYGWHKLMGNCYFFDDNSRRYKFHEAYYICQEKNAQVFQPKNEQINQIVYDLANILEFAYGSAYWIGLSKA